MGGGGLRFLGRLLRGGGGGVGVGVGMGGGIRRDVNYGFSKVVPLRGVLSSSVNINTLKWSF